MYQRRCSTPGCSRPHRARGFCSTHYNQANAKPVTTTCANCETSVTKDQPYSRRVVCSSSCRAYLQNDRWPRCEVPSSHISRATVCSVPPDHPSRVIPCIVRQCVWCVTEFVVTRESHRFCSVRCKTKAMRVRRLARASDGHTYSWSHVMRVLRLLNGRCAYCDMVIVGPPDPDHVVPLSRGGSNGNSNILPSCRPCNSDKRNLLLHEWVEDRARRNKPPVRTLIDRSHLAFSHLLPDAVTSSAAWSFIGLHGVAGDP